jgi:hypothetical protein
MESHTIFLLAVSITVLFLLFRFLEMKFIDKEYKPLKILLREAVMVFSASIIAAYGCFYTEGSVKDFLNVITETKTLDPAATQIFTDTPGF